MMSLDEQWREVTRLIENIDELVKSAQTVEQLAHIEDEFAKAEIRAKELLKEHPHASGEIPYEADFRTSSAGKLLYGVLRRVKQLQNGTIAKNVARTEISEMSVELLNLRADHGRFFQKLDKGIAQVENLYQKLLRQKASISPD